MNKKNITGMLSGFALLLATATLISAMPQKNDEVMTKEDGMYVVNTTTLGSKVIGYVGPTPVKIYIKKNKVVKVEGLKNQETPKYYAKVKKALFDQWNDKKVSDALTMQVDGVTGATFTSDAIKENVRLGLEYYKSHK